MNRFESYKKEVEPRITSLIKKEYYIEAFYICSASIEYLLQEMISHQEDWISDLVKKSGLRLSKIPPDRLKEKTLGQLIEIFSRYCIDDRLISELNEFNSFRKKVVHSLLDHTMKELNILAKKKMSNYYSLSNKLLNYGCNLLGKRVRKIKREIITIKSKN